MLDSFLADWQSASPELKRKVRRTGRVVMWRLLNLESAAEIRAGAGYLEHRARRWPLEFGIPAVVGWPALVLLLKNVAWWYPAPFFAAGALINVVSIRTCLGRMRRKAMVATPIG